MKADRGVEDRWHPGGAPLVLLIDDDADTRHFAALALTRGGCVVIEAAHGGDGLAQLLAHAPDLILLDLQMPVMDGWQFRNAQQQIPDQRLASVPVVLVTGEDDADAEGAALRVSAVMHKPVPATELLAAVHRALSA
jgi:CheY-like chemotaxis protein